MMQNRQVTKTLRCPLNMVRRAQDNRPAEWRLVRKTEEEWRRKGATRAGDSFDVARFSTRY